jgi:hypothetical protein
MGFCAGDRGGCGAVQRLVEFLSGQSLFDMWMWRSSFEVMLIIAKFVLEVSVIARRSQDA